MADTEINEPKHRGGDTGTVPHETVLRSEISFWKEMIGSRSEALPPEAVERMHFALALAEKRLAQIHEEHLFTYSESVYRLDRERRNVQ
jgi:hypothetical protein